jgi:uncharacterized protein YcbX
MDIWTQGILENNMETQKSAGTLVSVRRYPVKSMMGESLNASKIGLAGLAHDRGFALVDRETKKVVSAKNPSKWPAIFEFRAALATGDATGVRITLPDGRAVSSTDPDVDNMLSDIVGRPVNLISSAPPEAKLEEYWPDMEELPNRNIVTDESLPSGTFFDCATVHLLTTSTLDALRALHPQGRFEPRRFRPNLIVSTPDIEGFAENEWIGKTIQIGSTVRLKITGPCPRCVMTTLAQDDLPKDPLVLKTAARHNSAHVGAYASVMVAGTVHRNDLVVVQ